MGPVEFIKTCFAIECVMLFFVIFIKVSFALVDWLVERIREATLKCKIKRLLMEYLENPYSGVGYVIMHDTSNSTDGCPIAIDSDSSQGIYIYASKEAAINA